MDNKPPKPKTPQKQNLTEVDGRDTFQTPNYAVDLLIPFLALANSMQVNVIWECAAGLGKIVNRLEWDGFECIATDLSYDEPLNFIAETVSFPFDAIVTNPPFSLKAKFYKKCLEYGKPFALLVPADYSKWTIEAVDKDGCEKIIPNRRIDYITPNILRRIWEGETWESYVYKHTMTLDEFKEKKPLGWNRMRSECEREFLFDSIYDAPAELLKKYSSSYYHSMWLTWGFGIGKTETFVELSNLDKLNI